jgi:hypothetical protein
MFHTCEPFEVKVKNPLKADDGTSLIKGITLMVRAIATEHRLDGTFIVYFFVWNEARKRFMLEPAAQFEPMDK